MLKNKLLKRAHQLNIYNGFLNYWMSLLEATLESPSSVKEIFEFGSYDIDFLKFIGLYFYDSNRTGIIINNDSISQTLNDDFRVKYVNENAWNSPNKYDIGFSLEIFSLISDLDAHIDKIQLMLKNDGVYYSIFGWHSGNPCSEKRKIRRIGKGLKFYEYSLDVIANKFSKKGFEVGIKKITVPYYFIYEKELINRDYVNIENMISCLQDHKYILSFRKVKN